MTLERDSVAVVNARRRLWAILVELDRELHEAQHALTIRTKDKALRDFVRRLAGARLGLARLHACAYANSLVERHGVLSPLLTEADALATEAGLISKQADETAEKPPIRIWTPPSANGNGTSHETPTA